MPKLRVIIKPPPEPQGEPEQQVEALRDYLLQMSEELAYVLTHLEADNINDSTFERIQGMIPRPYTGLPVMDGEASAGQSEGWSRGDHRHPKDTSKADVTALEETAGDLADHVADTGNPHEVTAAQVGLGNVDNVRQYSVSNPPPIPTPGEVGAIPTTEKGSAGGVAELDSNGMVPSAQLPSYVDDVLEYASLSVFPTAGESGKIYVALDTGRTYRWSGSAYVEISESLALGETASTAYRGDRGKTAYDHSQLASGNPHNVSASDVGLGNVANERQYSALNPPPLPTPADIGAATAQDLTDHVGDTNNPHGVTAAQAGARPDTWTPTAADVGARPDTWTPSAADVGARPDDWVPDAEDVPYDNTGSGLMATDVQSAIDELAQGGGGGGTAASAVSYDNTGSGLTATNVQDAIDETLGDIPTQASDIGAQDEITASGILKGDGQGGVSAAIAGTDYQAPLTIDATPTASSTNPVQSGGVYTDVRTRVPNYGKGKNLLRNWYFVGGGTGRGVFPVNQRGQSSYSRNSYSIDGWFVNNTTNFGVSLNSSSLILTSSSYTGVFLEYIPHLQFGKQYTFSVLCSDGSLVVATGQINDSSEIIRVSFSGGAIVVWYDQAQIQCFGGYSFGVIAAKLELGPEQTLAHQENGVWVLNEIPDYEEELIKCQTSTADPSDTYANKSLATEQQLAYVETGTTASQNYTAGQYISLNGLLYTADTAIASGATFYTSGGNKNLTECVGGGMNSLRLKFAGSKTGKQAVSVPAEWTEVICMIWGVRDFTVSAVNIGRTVNTRFYADNTTGYVTITSTTCAIGEFIRNGQDQSSQCTLTVYYR